ncbi:MAG TPA: trimethylamine methyltransferase family protein, partial [Thermodesulfobacteriota bacterium]|nr:trimethylamine methyltransferase family protein [Thermodesulfobacteriota bacterium]
FPMTSSDIEKIHEASLSVLGRIGVAFHSPMALEIFRRHGFKTEEKVVRFSTKEVENALGSAPSQFTLFARNPEKNLSIGGGDTAFAPGYGAPDLITDRLTRRRATLADYVNFCRLAHTSDIVNVTGFLSVDPSDLPPQNYHLDMLYNNLILSDQPFIGSPLSGQTAQDAVNMAGIAFGRRDLPVMASIINSLQPLQFSAEMTESMIVFARHNQPIIVMGGGMMGATAPLRLSGLLCIQNAVVLAGITLAQLVRPGCPVIYGVGGSPMDMQTGAYYTGGPELSRAIRIGVAIAKHYNLPCRGGGALTDSHQMDFQAGAQSAFCIGQTLAGHLDFIIHSCGMLSSYMAMSYEKFIADEDLWRHALYLEKPLDLTDLDQEVEAIREAGVGGQFMTQERTVKFCRTELFRSPLMNRLPFEKWETVKNRTLMEKASSLVRERLECYQPPPIEKDIMKGLSDYVRARKKEINQSSQRV